jgi:hypothetical protein
MRRPARGAVAVYKASLLDYDAEARTLLSERALAREKDNDSLGRQCPLSSELHPIYSKINDNHQDVVAASIVTTVTVYYHCLSSITLEAAIMVVSRSQTFSEGAFG